jgi:4-hydroxybutyrate dehydrogenase
MTDGIVTIRYLTTASFGFGASALLGEVLAEHAIARPFVVTDPGVRATGIAGEVLAAACEPGRTTWFDRSPSNPTEAAVLEATEAFRAARCDGIVAIGGGSSIDLAKGVALLSTHQGPLIEYAAVHGGMERITSRVVPTIAIPTTAGTGSEVGRAAMINVDGRKLDFISPHLFPARALCDPGLTFGLPPYLTAATGMDALTHCIETYLSPLVNPPAEAIALDGVERAARWIEEATSNGRSRPARWNMMMASTEGALSFHKGLGAVHAMAHPLGALEDLPLHHGTLNAVLLPAVLRFNEPAAPEKYERLRRVIGLGADADLAAWVADLNARLGLPQGLAAMGVPTEILPRIAEHAEQDPATETNARPATRADYAEVLRASLGDRSLTWTCVPSSSSSAG